MGKMSSIVLKIMSQCKKKLKGPKNKVDLLVVNVIFLSFFMVKCDHGYYSKVIIP